MVKNKIFHCEAFNGLQMISNESIDYIITDPPNKINNEKQLWNEINKKLKPNGQIIIYTLQPYKTRFEQATKHLKHKTTIKIINIDMTKYLSQRKTNHNAEKPIHLILPIFENIKNKIILDPFFGSGTTIECCILTQNTFIGFDNDKKSYDITFNRIKKTLTEPPK